MKKKQYIKVMIFVQVFEADCIRTSNGSSEKWTPWQPI